MTLYIPKIALQSLLQLQEVTAVITQKPAKPEQWVKFEVPAPERK